MDIFTAAKNGDAGFISAYAKNGGDLEKADGNLMTPLLLAVDNGRLEAARLLVRLGVDPNRKDRWGQTALILAAGRDNHALVSLLIHAKADLNVKAVNGLTALGYALDNGYEESARLLKTAGAR